MPALVFFKFSTNALETTPNANESYFAFHAALAVCSARQTEDLLARSGLYADFAKPHAIRELLDELDRPIRREIVTILVADLRGSTELWQTVGDLERTREYLEEFLAMLVTAVHAAGGRVNKFLGDGLSAYFSGDAAAQRAVEAGAAMHRAFRTLPGRWAKTGNIAFDFLGLGVGIATDQVLLGSLRFGRVREYTALGPAMILAVRLVEHARGNDNFLIDRQTHRAVADRVTVSETRSLGLQRSEGSVGPRYEYLSIRSLHQGVGTAPVANTTLWLTRPQMANKSPRLSTHSPQPTPSNGSE
jgi:class 3 adenylate cyclase